MFKRNSPITHQYSSSHNGHISSSNLQHIEVIFFIEWLLILPIIPSTSFAFSMSKFWNPVNRLRCFRLVFFATAGWCMWDWPKTYYSVCSSTCSPVWLLDERKGKVRLWLHQHFVIPNRRIDSCFGAFHVNTKHGAALYLKLGWISSTIELPPLTFLFNHFTNTFLWFQVALVAINVLGDSSDGNAFNTIVSSLQLSLDPVLTSAQH